MRIITARRISQIFFLLLFVWFCLVTTLGDRWWQLRGWSVNWLIELDPLVGLGTILTTRTLYKGLVWGLVTISLTLLLGRFFCGWICPFGTIHQFIGYLGKRSRSVAQRLSLNRYHRWQAIKYWILIFLLASASLDLVFDLLYLPQNASRVFAGIIALVLVISLIIVWRQSFRAVISIFAAAGVWMVIGLGGQPPSFFSASLQIGLLDPLPLLYRSINLVVLPIVGGGFREISPALRYYDGIGLIGLIFLLAVFLNLKIPRFYCRFICPLGALLGVLSRYAIWRIGKADDACRDCQLCEQHCDGACAPTSKVRFSECVLCFNCMDSCRHGLIGYRSAPSAAGEITGPDVTKREFTIACLSGLAAIPAMRLNGHLAANWIPTLIRPPGALAEKEFLARCIKCGQCMRICPTNILHPTGLASGIEGLWTPAANFRIGSSGCQLKCIACGNVCPTAAIRPISLDERLGQKRFERHGPIRIGTAFVDRGRCLPWAMDKPCIVCQENCPVSPKAIFTRVSFNTVIDSHMLTIRFAAADQIEFDGTPFQDWRLDTGDYFLAGPDTQDYQRWAIQRHTANRLWIRPNLQQARLPVSENQVAIQIRLQRPFVEPNRCIGCGVCEHECPVRGKRAIRVTAENESRHRDRQLLLQS